METQATNPPRRAARVPVSMVSLYSKPGSLKCVCRSMRPGTRQRFFPSTVCVACAERFFPSFEILPLSIRQSRVSSTLFLGSMARILRNRIDIFVYFLSYDSAQKIKNRHTHRDTVRDLVENHGMRTVSDFIRQLHAPVAGARVHDQNIFFGSFQALLIDAESFGVFPHAGEKRFLLSLELNPEQGDRVGVVDRK